MSGQLLAALLLLAASFAPGPAAALEVEGAPLLHPREAFTFESSLQDGVAEVVFTIAPGYYMYRDRIAFAAEQGVELGEASKPAGITVNDEFFGDVMIYRDQAAISVPVAAGGDEVRMVMVSQGCADIGVCFPPEQVTLAFAAGGGTGSIVGDYSLPDYSASSVSFPPATQAVALDESAQALAVLEQGSLIAVLLAFLGFGLLLAFTPCVLPMVPIVLAVITGGKSAPGTARAFGLCAAYVAAMAAVYAVLGVAAAGSGLLLSYYLQHPIVVVALAAIFMALGAAQLGLFEMRIVPQAAGGLLNSLRSMQGTLRGAVLFGAASAIVVSPCVAAPLVGALLFIAQSNDLALGGAALASLGVGMGILPLVIAAGAGALLPRAGAGSAVIRQLFGLLMFGLAVWIAAALLPPVVRMIAYAAIGLAAAWLIARACMASANRKKAAGGFAAAALCLAGAAVMLFGAATGASSELRPLARLGSSASPQFALVNNLDGLAVKLAAERGPTMIEFTAEWCVSCRELEEYTFSDDQVAARLGEMNLIRIDVTDASPASRTLLAHYGLFGPPALIFIDRAGSERGRVIGYQPPGRFLKTLDSIES